LVSSEGDDHYEEIRWNKLFHEKHTLLRVKNQKMKLLRQAQVDDSSSALGLIAFKLLEHEDPSVSV
jgi:hypothetical protein